MPISEELVAEVNDALSALTEQKAEDVKTDENLSVDKEVEESNGDKQVIEKTDVSNTENESNEGEVDNKSSDIDDKQGKADTSIKGDEIGSVISDYALTQAVQTGLSIEEAREFGSDKLLMRAVDMVRKAAERATPKASEKTEDDPFAAIPDFKPDEFDSPEVARAFNLLKEISKKQANELKQLKTNTTQSNAAQQNARQDAAVREATEWFDAKVNSLGKDFEEALGTGTYDKLVKGSPQLARRDAVAEHVAVLLAGYNAAGKTVPPRDEVFDAAARLVLKDEFQKIKDVKMAEGLAKRETQHLNRAGGQKIKPNQNPLEAVAAEADEFIKSRR